MEFALLVGTTKKSLLVARPISSTRTPSRPAKEVTFTLLFELLIAKTTTCQRVQIRHCWTTEGGEETFRGVTFMAPLLPFRHCPSDPSANSELQQPFGALLGIGVLANSPPKLHPIGGVVADALLWAPVLRRLVNWVGARRASTESITKMFADGFKVRHCIKVGSISTSPVGLKPSVSTRFIYLLSHVVSAICWLLRSHFSHLD